MNADLLRVPVGPGSLHVERYGHGGTPVVLLVMNGRPLDLRWAAEHVPAILDVWYPGTSGGAAVANLVFGDVSPGGKLPFTWPRTVGQVPMILGHTTSHEPVPRIDMVSQVSRKLRPGASRPIANRSSPLPSVRPAVP